MVQAKWYGQIIAESESYEQVEGNVYFPFDSIKKEFFKESKLETSCPWKGKASYYDLVVDGKTNLDAAWYYPTPSSEAENIKGYVAFWKGVEILD